jgi:alpha-ribazole phosphatase
VIAERLPEEPSRILVSPMIRTRQTAEPYCKRCSVQPETIPELAEFSVICPTLIAGLSGSQRKPFVEAYWADSDPHRRMGPSADTFMEFNERVGEFEKRMQGLLDGTVIFGHGIWFGLLVWRLQGNRATDGDDMRRFRRFQLALPMPNCAEYELISGAEGWAVRAIEKRRNDASRA